MLLISKFVKSPEPWPQYLTGHNRLCKPAATATLPVGHIVLHNDRLQLFDRADALRFGIFKRPGGRLDLRSLYRHCQRSKDLFPRLFLRFILRESRFKFRPSLLPKIYQYHQRHRNDQALKIVEVHNLMYNFFAKVLIITHCDKFSAEKTLATLLKRQETSATSDSIV